jgi:hypothetical protein
MTKVANHITTKSPTTSHPRRNPSLFQGLSNARRKTSRSRTSQARRKSADRPIDRKLSRSELEVLAVSYAALLGIRIQRYDPRDFGFRVGPGRGRPQWIALGECEPDEAGGLANFWHCGPGSRCAVAVQALGAMGYRLRSNGELYEI